MGTTNPSLPVTRRFAAGGLARTVHASRSSSLLLVDEDKAHCSALARALERKQYRTTVVHDYVSALAFAEHNPPDFAVVALTYPGGLGLCFIAKLLTRSPRARIVALADYASMATATEALKLGASYFLPKPAKAEDLLAILGGGFAAAPSVTPKAHASSLQKVQWEHMLRVLTQNNGNISAAARELGMYRRTLQRKLGKNPPRA
jgi:two-component system, response regulator RegA